MAGDFSPIPILGIVTPNDPDHRGHGGYRPSPRRQKPAPPARVPAHLLPEAPLPGMPDPEPPATRGTRIDIRV